VASPSGSAPAPGWVSPGQSIRAPGARSFPRRSPETCGRSCVGRLRPAHLRSPSAEQARFRQVPPGRAEPKASREAGHLTGSRGEASRTGATSGVAGETAAMMLVAGTGSMPHGCWHSSDGRYLAPADGRFSTALTRSERASRGTRPPASYRVGVAELRGANFSATPSIGTEKGACAQGHIRTQGP
jgi:hypothetical protein